MMKNRMSRKALPAFAAGVLSSSLLLTGCIDVNEGDEITQTKSSPDSGGNTGNSGTVESCDAGTSTSGFAFPCDAIFVAPDAESGDDITEDLLVALFELPENAVVVLPRGEFTVSETITVNSASGVVLTGHGIKETKLDFSDSTGDDSIRFEGGSNLTIRDFGVYESNKNAIKVTNASGVHFAYTATVWEGPLESDNGAYGLYPLQSRNVLLEHNYAAGSADAGIYVGQSSDVVIRDNVAVRNVAGIEVENTLNADVYNNMATGNTAGILVFDLPGLTNAYGGNVRVFNNTAYANNAPNVGAGAVAIAPPGTGILVFATSDVEIFNNDITDNDTTAIAIASYLLADDDLANYPAKYGQAMTNGWTPLVRNVYAHNNFIARNSTNPQGTLLVDIINGYTSPYNASGMAQVFPAILYDGVGELLANAGQLTAFQDFIPAGSQAEADGVSYQPYGAEDQICANNNVNGNPATTYDDVNTGQVFGTDPMNPANWNAAGTAPAPSLLIEPMIGSSLLNCAHNRLPPATVSINGVTYGCTGDDLSEAACAL
ncbi:parallel beta-helix domain-containing protein [Alcanivorax sp.]|uniref:parallel beta-helix domain-containing protein n=1 Tax=Alcanivorax sp. TaxID=1872427 RepID=UPI0025C138F0|nr:parallel beta-helix domain-containing protein [Alcanivorax sp.]